MGINEDDRTRAISTTSLSVSVGDAGGGRARPSNVIAAVGPVASSGKSLTPKEQAAAEEAKDKLERLVKVGGCRTLLPSSSVGVPW